MFRGLSVVLAALALAADDGNQGEHEAGSTGGKPSEHETGSAADQSQPTPKSSRKARAKPRAKWRLSAAQLQQRRNAAKARAKTLTKEHQAAAGKALARKKGSAYMQEMGTRGGEIARARHPGLPERAGEANWERIKRLRAEKVQAEQAPPTEAAGQGEHETGSNGNTPTTGDTETNSNE